MQLNLTKKNVALLLFVMNLIFYGNTLLNDFSLDDSYIFNQIPKEDKSITNAFSVFKQRFDYVDYRPLPMLTFALEQSIFGQIIPGISHAVNVFLFWLVCYSVFLFVSSLPVSNSRLLGVIVAIIFLCHPVHANTVNNLKSRDTLMSCLFSLLVMYYWVKSLEEENKFNVRYILFSMIFFLLGLFCKLDTAPVFLTLPLIFILFRNKQSVKKSIPYVLLFFFIFLFIRMNLIEYLLPAQPEKSLGVLFMENPIVNQFNLNYKIGQSVIVLYWYLKFMLIPFGYYFYFGYNMIPLYPATHPISILLLLFHFCILFLSLYLIVKKKDKIAGFGILFFYISLSYCLNIVSPVAGIVADRYAFIASLGYCILLGTVILRISGLIDNYIHKNKSKQKAKQRQPFTYNTKQIALIGPVVIITLFYLPSAWSRNAAWENMLTLLETDMPHLEQSYEANRIATKAYLNKAKFTSSKDSAVYYLEKGLQTATQANSIYPNEIFILESIGISNMALGKTETGIETFRKVISLTDSSLVSCDAYGDYLLRKSMFDSAAYYYYNTIIIAPDDPESYYKYMTARLYNKQFDLMLHFSDSIIEKHPKFYPAYECKGFTYLNMADTLNASAAYLTAFELGMKSQNIARMFGNYHYRKNNINTSRKFFSFQNM